MTDTALPLENGRFGPLGAGVGGGLGALVGYSVTGGVDPAVLAGLGGGLGALIGMYVDYRFA
ncbi:MAG: hypothetical protein ABEJ68_01490 [Halobacteriaceae archaeon]